MEHITSDLIGNRVTATARDDGEVLVGIIRGVAVSNAVVLLLLQVEARPPNHALFTDARETNEIVTVSTLYWRVVLEPRT